MNLRHDDDSFTMALITGRFLEIHEIMLSLSPNLSLSGYSSKLIEPRGYRIYITKMSR